MTKQRQPHADFIIEQANDTSLRFDVKQGFDWRLVIEVPGKFHPDNEYRLHEREFPKTSLSAIEFREIWFNLGPGMSIDKALAVVANASIRQYILDTEKESK